MIKRLFVKAFSLTSKIFPWNLRTVVFSILSSILFFFGRWQILGRGIAIQYLEEIIIEYISCLVLFMLILFFVNLARAPFQIIKEQDEINKLLTGKKDKEKVLIDLEIQRRKGVELRNKGIKLLSEATANEWWKDHLDWRKKTAETIELINKEKAERWKTLDRYTPSNSYQNAITPEHRHRLQMFDEWLLRLSKVADDFSKEKIL